MLSFSLSLSQSWINVHREHTCPDSVTDSLSDITWRREQRTQCKRGRRKCLCTPASTSVPHTIRYDRLTRYGRRQEYLCTTQNSASHDPIGAYDRRHSAQYFVLKFVHHSRSTHDQERAGEDSENSAQNWQFLSKHLVKAFPTRKIAGKTVFHSSTVFNCPAQHLW